MRQPPGQSAIGAALSRRNAYGKRDRLMSIILSRRSAQPAAARNAQRRPGTEPVSTGGENRINRADWRHDIDRLDVDDQTSLKLQVQRVGFAARESPFTDAVIRARIVRGDRRGRIAINGLLIVRAATVRAAARVLADDGGLLATGAHTRSAREWTHEQGHDEQQCWKGFGQRGTLPKRTLVPC